MICDPTVPYDTVKLLDKSFAFHYQLNLAEGYGRSTRKDQKRFFDIALGSLRECQAVLEITGENQTPKILADKLAAHIFCLIKALS